MSARPGTAGATRTCPHCKATILESASVCPACRGHLRYDDAALQRAKTATVPLKIEGTINPPRGETASSTELMVIVENASGRRHQGEYTLTATPGS